MSSDQAHQASLDDGVQLRFREGVNVYELASDTVNPLEVLIFGEWVRVTYSDYAVVLYPREAFDWIKGARLDLA